MYEGRKNIWIAWQLKNGIWLQHQRCTYQFVKRFLKYTPKHVPFRIKFKNKVYVVGGVSSTLRAERLSDFFAEVEGVIAKSVPKSSIGGE